MLKLRQYWPSAARWRGVVILGLLLLFALALSALASEGVFATGRNSLNTKIQGWIGQLSQDRLTSSRQEAQAQLEKAGDAAVNPLIASLHASDPVLRRNSAEMLGYIGSPNAASALAISLMHDPDPAVRSEAAWSLSQLVYLDQVGVVERASVTDPDETVRQSAADALDGLRSTLAVWAGRDERLTRAFAVAPSDARTVYLAQDDKVSVSQDGGKTWRAVGKTPSRVVTLAVSPNDTSELYAGTESLGLYKSTDGGTTWKPMSGGLGVESGTPVGVTAIAIDPQHPSHIYVAMGIWIGTSQERLFPQGVMTSPDDGKTWVRANFPSTNDPVTRMVVISGKIYGVSGSQVLSAAS